MVGSSFTSPAESNYAPIEGECLGVANALHKTRYYTQGCDKLVIGTDHKPLLGVLNDRSLESIDNPRLKRLKEKTLGWRFRIVHIPGKKLGGPDALSRAVAVTPGENHMLAAYSNGCLGCQPELFALPTDPVLLYDGTRSVGGPTATGWGMMENMDMQEEMTTKDAREGITQNCDGVKLDFA